VAPIRTERFDRRFSWTAGQRQLDLQRGKEEKVFFRRLYNWERLARQEDPKRKTG